MLGSGAAKDHPSMDWQALCELLLPGQQYSDGAAPQLAAALREAAAKLDTPCNDSHDPMEQPDGMSPPSSPSRSGSSRTSMA